MDLLVLWFQLWIPDGNGDKIISTSKVSIPSTADVADFRKAVKVEYANKLSSVDSGDLSIFKSKAAIDANDPALAPNYSFTDDPNIGQSMENAIVVVVPFLPVAPLIQQVASIQNQSEINLSIQAKERGNEFVKSIMAKDCLQVIVDQQLYYMKKIYMLRDFYCDIVISQNIQKFWSRCIEKTKPGKRVCASGSPGVGKSTSMMYLIRLLLKMEKRVVYITMTREKNGFYYEWEVSSDGTFTTNVYPESQQLTEIILENAENFKNTYFLCDPGETKGNMMPSNSFLGNVIGSASADDAHWGGSEFKKRREGYAHGLVLTFPMFTKEQIFQAREHFKDHPDELTLEKRHRDFGSIPRHLFEGDDAYRKQQIVTQNQALFALSGDMATRIMNNNDKDAPRSAIMCVTAEPPLFLDSIAYFVSDRVAEQAAKAHLKHLWFGISSENSSSNRGNL